MDRDGNDVIRASNGVKRTGMKDVLNEFWGGLFIKAVLVGLLIFFVGVFVGMLI